MNTVRRSFVLAAATASCTLLCALARVHAADPPQEAKKMYGIIAKLTAANGKRDELIAHLVQGTKEMPGCLSYIVAKDPADANSIWISEAWEDEASHKASLSLPAVREAITKGRPLIAKFQQIAITQPVGGYGLTPAKRR